MGHDHNHHSDNKKVLKWSFFLILTFMIVEVIGGILTNSLALLSDAGHMLSDAAALGLSLLAIIFGTKAASSNKTYGYRRFEILAAFINGLTLILISLYIFWEAYHRLMDPPNVSSGMMMIAVIGLIVNIIVAWVLHRGHKEENLNIKSAYLHVLGDLLGSVGAISAGLLIYFFDWNIADPIASVIVAILVLISGWRVTKESLHVLMEGKPGHINIDELKEELGKIENVCDVHDLHVWSITSNFPSLTCHLIVNQEVDRDLILKQATNMLRNKFQVKHSTIQIEGEDIVLHEDEDCCN